MPDGQEPKILFQTLILLWSVWQKIKIKFYIKFIHWGRFSCGLSRFTYNIESFHRAYPGLIASRPNRTIISPQVQYFIVGDQLLSIKCSPILFPVGMLGKTSPAGKSYPFMDKVEMFHWISAVCCRIESYFVKLFFRFSLNLQCLDKKLSLFLLISLLRSFIFFGSSSRVSFTWFF